MRITVRMGFFEYSEVIDLKDLWLEGIDDPEQTPLSFFHFTRPTQEFRASDIERYNGDHYVYGWWECFTQSDNSPQKMKRHPNLVYLRVE